MANGPKRDRRRPSVGQPGGVQFAQWVPIGWEVQAPFNLAVTASVIGWNGTSVDREDIASVGSPMVGIQPGVFPGVIVTQDGVVSEISQIDFDGSGQFVLTVIGGVGSGEIWIYVFQDAPAMRLPNGMSCAPMAIKVQEAP